MRARTNILRSRRIEGPLKSGYFHSSSVNPMKTTFWKKDWRERTRKSKYECRRNSRKSRESVLWRLRTWRRPSVSILRALDHRSFFSIQGGSTGTNWSRDTLSNRPFIVSRSPRAFELSQRQLAVAETRRIVFHWRSGACTRCGAGCITMTVQQRNTKEA